jgi:hypothetical protein
MSTSAAIQRYVRQGACGRARGLGARITKRQACRTPLSCDYYEPNVRAC